MYKVCREIKSCTPRRARAAVDGSPRRGAGDGESGLSRRQRIEAAALVSPPPIRQDVNSAPFG